MTDELELLVKTEEERLKLLFQNSIELDASSRLKLIEDEIVGSKRLLLLMIRTMITQSAEYGIHHEYIKTKIEEERAKRDFWHGLGKQAAAAGILGAVGLLGSALWYAFTTFVKEIK